MTNMDLVNAHAQAVEALDELAEICADMPGKKEVLDAMRQSLSVLLGPDQRAAARVLDALDQLLVMFAGKDADRQRAGLVIICAECGDQVDPAQEMACSTTAAGAVVCPACTAARLNSDSARKPAITRGGE